MFMYKKEKLLLTSILSFVVEILICVARNSGDNKNRVFRIFYNILPLKIQPLNIRVLYIYSCELLLEHIVAITPSDASPFLAESGF